MSSLQTSPSSAPQLQLQQAVFGGAQCFLRLGSAGKARSEQNVGILALIAWCVLLHACGGRCEGAAAPTPELPPCSGHQLRDAQGRVRILRGVNLSGSAKWSRGHLPQTRDWQLQSLRDDFGFNALRFLVFWEAIEPWPGSYDTHYLQAVRHHVAAAAAAGFFVLVDMHQDIFGRGFAQAGAPRWSCNETLYASFQPPENWLLGYLQPEVATCFDRLYLHRETRAAFASAWQRLAEALGDVEGEIVFELLNEPFWGSRSAREFDQEVAPAFYAEIISALRLQSPWRWIAIEPAPTANVGIPTSLQHPGGKRLVYAPHFYPQAVEIEHRYRGDTQALRRQVRGLCQDANRLQMPLFIGEVGARRTTVRMRSYLEDLYQIFDAEGISAWLWDASHSGTSGYGIWTKNGGVAPQGEAVARPYPSRTVGQLQHWHWNAATKVFDMQWEETPQARGMSEVMLPKLAFPAGFLLELQPSSPTVLQGSRLSIGAVGGPRHLWVRSKSL